MHNFQLAPWSHARLLTYCSCGWVGGVAPLQGNFPEMFVAQREWGNHVKNSPRSFDNQTGRVMPRA